MPSPVILEDVAKAESWVSKQIKWLQAHPKTFTFAQVALVLEHVGVAVAKYLGKI